MVDAIVVNGSSSAIHTGIVVEDAGICIGLGPVRHGCGTANSRGHANVGRRCRRLIRGIGTAGLDVGIILAEQLWQG